MSTTEQPEAADAPSSTPAILTGEISAAIARLVTEVARMDATDLGYPWADDCPSRRARVVSFITRLDPEYGIVKADDGRGLAAAITRAWTRRREQHAHEVHDRRDDELGALIDDVNRLRVELDAGVRADDLPHEPHG